jgi:hypothetical protein
MTIEPAELLDRMATAMRRDVAPHVDDEFARTQAVMSAVILAKLSSQLQTSGAGAAAAAEEHVVLPEQVRAALGADPPSALAAALDALLADGSTRCWNDVVAAMWSSRDELDAATFDRSLGVIRATLRARLDRALAYAR